MSVRATDENTAVGLATGRRESDSVKQRTSGTDFKEFLTASSRNIGAGEDNSRIAKTAEILHLEMMRNTLSLGSSANSTSTTGSSGVEALISLLSSAGQKIDLLSKGPESSGVPATTDISASVKSASSSSANDPSLNNIISRAAKRYGVEESLIKAVIKTESNFSRTAVSHAGAQGLMQLMPATAASLGVSDPFNPEQNVMAGTRFLKDMLNRYGGDMD